MTLFRTRDTDPRGWQRFTPGADRFSHVREGPLHVVRVAATAERSAELFHALLEELPDEVDVALECLRSGRRWSGVGLSRPEVRDAIARLKVPLAARGGVEVTVYTPDDQLALSAMLDLWCYGVSDRWVYLLLGRGLEAVPLLPERGWALGRGDFVGGADVVQAVERAAETLTLRPA